MTQRNVTCSFENAVVIRFVMKFLSIFLQSDTQLLIKKKNNELAGGWDILLKVREVDQWLTNSDVF